MSWVMSYEKCKKCGGAVSVDFNCSTMEEYNVCNCCGKTEVEVLEKDEKGKLILKKHENGKEYPFYNTIKAGGYGTFHHKIAGDMGFNITTFDNELTDEEIDAIIDIYNSEDTDKKQSFAVLFNPETKKVTTICGVIPKIFFYEDFVEEAV